MESLHELQHPLLDKKSNPTGSKALLIQESDSLISDQAGFFSGHAWKCFPHSPYSSTELNGKLTQQLLDAGTLQRTVEPYCTPEPALYPDLALWKSGETHNWKKKDYIETTFVDTDSGLAENGDLTKKLLADKDLHTVSYDVGDTDLPELENDSSSESDTDSESNFSMIIPQDYLGLAVFSMLCCFWPLGIAAFYLSQKTNKASAKGDYHSASTASRQTFFMAVLSIVLGTCTYIGAIVALIAYLSNKAPT
ncbi:transmembrane protein 91 [Ambystoma mexicanum]|uniref:transmembrane protein 91 n=1 Tax=Ambystoma mexicanum TaxID=8296 RepID=UPI0037E987B3